MALSKIGSALAGVGMLATIHSPALAEDKNIDHRAIGSTGTKIENAEVEGKLQDAITEVMVKYEAYIDKYKIVVKTVPEKYREIAFNSGVESCEDLKKTDMEGVRLDAELAEIRNKNTQLDESIAHSEARIARSKARQAKLTDQLIAGALKELGQ